ncbi:MYXO-CTERM sorting domain-containing protein [Haliangium sp.]|uniref:MYXO-CTERM sorting domain-containing protein n=1 Tax=Haliangium sp. TaxID=2663208 RepID=UPI003D14FA90
MRNYILLASCIVAWTSPASAQVINEIRADEDFPEPDEYIEIAGPADTNLDDYTILVLGDDREGANSTSGVIEQLIELSGETIGSSGYFVIAKSSFTLGTADLTVDMDLEDDDNTTYFLVTGFTGALNDDLDTDDDGVLDVEPWTQVVDRIALLEEDNPPSSTEFHYGPPNVGPDGQFTPAHVYRCPDGDAAGSFEIGDYNTSAGGDTPGAENDNCPPVAPMPDAGVPDAGMPTDAGVPDASVPGVPDAGGDTPDGGTDGPDGGDGPGTVDAGPDNPPPPPDDGGCCSASGRMNSTNLGLMLLVGAYLLLRRRRRGER